MSLVSDIFLFIAATTGKQAIIFYFIHSHWSRLLLKVDQSAGMARTRSGG